MPAITSNTTSTKYRVKGPFDVKGGNDFGGGTVTLKWEDDDGTGVDWPNSAFTSGFAESYDSIGPCIVYLEMTGATSPDFRYEFTGEDIKPINE